MPGKWLGMLVGNICYQILFIFQFFGCRYVLCFCVYDFETKRCAINLYHEGIAKKEGMKSLLLLTIA